MLSCISFISFHEVIRASCLPYGADLVLISIHPRILDWRARIADAATTTLPFVLKTSPSIPYHTIPSPKPKPVARHRFLSAQHATRHTPHNTRPHHTNMEQRLLLQCGVWYGMVLITPQTTRNALQIYIWLGFIIRTLGVFQQTAKGEWEAEGMAGRRFSPRPKGSALKAWP